jgi:hypothetical protein
MIRLMSTISVSGDVKIKAFQPGLIGSLLASGMSLGKAILYARERGALYDECEYKNLDTNVGLQFICRRISGEETVGLTYLAVGTGDTDPTAADTTLETEVLRKALVECKQGDVYFYSSTFLLAAESAYHIKEGALFGGVDATATADSGIMLARFLLDYDNSADPKDLTIQHTGKLEAN